MQNSNTKNSSEVFGQNQELNEDITDKGLPKSCLINFSKEILDKNKVRGDKNLIPMLDKISKVYVAYLSSLGCKICTDSGKKTLNIEHIIEALKQMNFNEHIELLKKDAIKEDKDQEKLEESEDNKKKNENAHLKQMINKKKKRGSRKKKYFEDENERETIKNMQAKLFEEARNELKNKQYDQCLQQTNMFYQGEYGENMNINLGLSEQSREKKDEIDYKNQNIGEIDNEMFINKSGEEDKDFDNIDN